MGIFRLKNYGIFVERPEVFPDVHLARADALCLVVGCRVVITFDDKLNQELGYFFNFVWGRLGPALDLPRTVLERYSWWLNRLDDAPGEASPVSVNRLDFWPMLAAAFPPPPPNRPGVAPAYTPPPSLPANYYGHLPFQTTSEPHEHFYRFEAWPQSRKITIGSPGQIAPGTYASPRPNYRSSQRGLARWHVRRSRVISRPCFAMCLNLSRAHPCAAAQ